MSEMQHKTTDHSLLHVISTFRAFHSMSFLVTIYDSQAFDLS